MTSSPEAQSVKMVASLYLATQFSDIYKREAFLKDTTHQIMSELLDRSDIHVSSEEEVCYTPGYTYLF